MTYLLKALSERDGAVVLEVETAPDYAGFVSHQTIEIPKHVLADLKEMLLEP